MRSTAEKHRGEAPRILPTWFQEAENLRTELLQTNVKLQRGADRTSVGVGSMQDRLTKGMVHWTCYMSNNTIDDCRCQELLVRPVLF